MPIDLLSMKTTPLQQELAFQALEILRLPLKARKLEDVRSIVVSRAPVRIDSGGWSDCWWFLEKHPGFVCSIALGLYSYVVIVVYKHKGGVVYEAPDLGESGELTQLEEEFVSKAARRFKGAFDGRGALAIVSSLAPPNAGLGSSGSVGVANVAALACLSGKWMSREEIAYLAHEIEFKEQDRETGIQDQVIAACGSSAIEMLEGESPKFIRTPLEFPPGMIQAFENGLILVNTAEGRISSDEHDRKIAMIKAGGPEAEAALTQICRIRDAAKVAAQSIQTDSWSGFCDAVAMNWRHQVALDPLAVTKRIRAITNVARRHSAVVKGWGAAGGGVMGILCPRGREQRDRILRGLAPKLDKMRNPDAHIIPTTIATDGVEVATFTEQEFLQLIRA